MSFRYRVECAIFALSLQESLLCHWSTYWSFSRWVTRILVAVMTPAFSMLRITSIFPHWNPFGESSSLSESLIVWMGLEPLNKALVMFSSYLTPWIFLCFFMGFDPLKNTWISQETGGDCDYLNNLVTSKIIGSWKKCKVNEMLSIHQHHTRLAWQTVMRK